MSKSVKQMEGGETMTEKIENKKIRYSNKAMTIYQLKTLVEFFNEKDEKNDFQILLITPFGFIKGDLEEINENKDDFISLKQKSPDTPDTYSYDVDISYLIKLRSEHLSELQSEKEVVIVDNGATLNFRNVEVYKDNLSNPIATFEQMLVFADQIISFSIVPRQIS